VPQRLTTYLAPVQFDDEGWGIWRAGFLGMRLDVVQELVEPEAHLHFFTTSPVLLGDPVALADSTGIEREARPDRPVTVPIARRGCLQAIVGYFTATLVPGVSLSNLPSYPGCNWAVWVWPLRHATVGAGDAIRVQVCRPEGERVVTDWRLDCRLLRNGRT
jgi:enediyne biosynthesis protein CalE3